MSAVDRTQGAVGQVRRLVGLAPLPPKAAPEPDGAALHVSLAATLPSLALRLAPVVLVAAVAGVTGGGPVLLLVVAALAVVAAWRPALPVAAWLTAAVGLWLLANPDPLTQEAGFDGLVRLGALVLLLHLLSAATGLAAHAPWRGVVELTVLGRALLRVAVVQVPVQALLALVWWWRTQSEPLDSEVLRAIAVLCAVGVALLVLPRRNGARRGWLPG